jgi:hypothetical protein
VAAEGGSLRRATYEHLYIQLGKGPVADVHAWEYVGGMLIDAYMPAAQRAALFRAAAMITASPSSPAPRTPQAARVSPWR